MAETVYVVDVELDRTGFVIVVNDIPAEHALSTHRVRMPVNEYVHAGANQLTIETSPWGSNAEQGSPGKARIRVSSETVVNERVVGSAILVDEEREFDQFPVPPAPIFAASFASEINGAPNLAGFAPLTAGGREQIGQRLFELAAALREGDADTLLDALSRYFERYEAAYAHVERGTMAREFSAMLAAFQEVGAAVTCQPQLRPRRGGLVVDCLGPRGAAIQATAPGMPPYNLWLVMAMRDGKPTIVA